MAILSTAITFLIGMALLLACHWIRYGRSVTRPSSMADEAFGLSALSLPAGWRAAKNLNEQAGIQALDPLRGRYVIVISEFKSDSPTLTLEEHARLTMSTLVASKRLLAVRGPWHRLVGGHEALQYEVDAWSHDWRVTYLHTTVAGERGLHQILGWATSHRYSRAGLDRILDGFSELPSAAPVVATPLPTPPPDRDSTSRYQVH